MSEPIWNKFLTERDKAVFGTSGYGARGGFGKRPALLIIDVNYAFCDERPMPILESIKRWRNSCGEDAWVAMPYLKALIDKAHSKGIPVIYTTGVRREDNWDNGSWSWKNDRSDEDRVAKPATNVDGNEIVAEIAPAPQDIVVLKQKTAYEIGVRLVGSEMCIRDRNYAFCDERPMPILESIKRWRNSCGEDAWVCLLYTSPSPRDGLLSRMPSSA